MGLSVTCAITNLPIGWDDEAVGFFVVQQMVDHTLPVNSCDATTFWDLIPIPLAGKYDGYCGMKDVNDDVGLMEDYVASHFIVDGKPDDPKADPYNQLFNQSTREHLFVRDIFRPEVKDARRLVQHIYIRQAVLLEMMTAGVKVFAPQHVNAQFLHTIIPYKWGPEDIAAVREAMSDLNWRDDRYKKLGLTGNNLAMLLSYALERRGGGWAPRPHVENLLKLSEAEFANGVTLLAVGGLVRAYLEATRITLTPQTVYTEGYHLDFTVQRASMTFREMIRMLRHDLSENRIEASDHDDINMLITATQTLNDEAKALLAEMIATEQEQADEEAARVKALRVERYGQSLDLGRIAPLLQPNDPFLQGFLTEALFDLQAKQSLDDLTLNTTSYFNIAGDCSKFAKNDQFKAAQEEVPALNLNWCGQSFWKARQGFGAGIGFLDAAWPFDNELQALGRSFPKLEVVIENDQIVFKTAET